MNKRLLGSGLLLLAGWGGRRYLRRRTGRDLLGNIVLITGGSRGLGLTIAHEFAKRGCHVVLAARNAEQLEQARQEVAQHGGQVMAHACDVGNRSEVDQLFAAATKSFGRIDILVNNAGTIITGPLETQTEEDFRESMDTMFWGTYYPTIAVLPQMRDRKDGRIVNIASIGGVVGAPHLLPYSAAKFAVAGFSQGLHSELRGHGIKVTTVIPGFMRTGSYTNAVFKGKHREEYRWFSVGSSLPILSTTAKAAAEKIVDAAQHGDAVLLITPHVKVAMLLNAISPGLVSFLVALVARILPRPGGIGTERRLGRQSEGRISRSFVTALGRRAARQYQHQ